MKIYTKTGDAGYTSLIGGKRVSKSHIRIESYGTVDELNSYVGLIRCQEIDIALQPLLKQIQEKLFIIGALLAADPEKTVMKLPEIIVADIAQLENEIDVMDAVLPMLKYFILPGGSNAVSYCHLARCVCRRAERHVVLLAESSTIDKRIVIYLNRLSDYFFVLARKIGNDQHLEETAWIVKN